MSLLKKLSILLFLIGIYSPAFSAVNGFEPDFCQVFSEGDEAGDKKGEEGEEEEEPDCE